jgi:hypothetical protein
LYFYIFVIPVDVESPALKQGVKVRDNDLGSLDFAKETFFPFQRVTDVEHD